MHNVKLLRAVIAVFSVIPVIFYASCAPMGRNAAPQLDSIPQEHFTAGDGLRIVVYPDSASFLNNIYPIDSDGNIFLPVAGKVKVTSMTVEQLIIFLQKNFQQYLRYPEIQVRPLIRVSMLGGFFRPGLYYVEPDRSIWDLVYLAGGTQNEDGLKELRWERDRRVVAGNLIPYIESGDAISAIGFRSGDQIWTPPERIKGVLAKTGDILLDKVLPLTTLILSIYISWLSIQNNSN